MMPSDAFQVIELARADASFPDMVQACQAPVAADRVAFLTCRRRFTRLPQNPVNAHRSSKLGTRAALSA